MTVVTSFIDSFNPFAIAQQFTLQGLLKKTHHIWYYIVTLFLTNYLASFIFYTGVSILNEQFLSTYWTILAFPTAILAFITGSVLIWYSIRSFLINWKARKFLMDKSDKESKEIELKFSEKKITPASLIGIGFTTTVVEFSTAAPFIAYLTVVQQFQPTLGQLLFLLLIYNLIFSWPLFALYFLFVGFQTTFEKIYTRMNFVLQMVSAFLLPILFFIIALLLIAYAGNSFFQLV
ncbi:MAG: hypothetical protein ABS896_10160 [Carnobacterium inhibens]|uniref:Uncharacterized protein n=1 Tax=Carnobacterium inhibens subsp. gilichinskyi TaxID=1266845 RepID=U5SC40_9LACT|nr:hypothetical protein Q783_09830 [Carnobacterium inhibens subsp. gilichinskyi]